MFPAADLPDLIPLFPLPGALLLPRARLPLHIFEPRYLAMLDDTLKTGHRLIGMVQPMQDEGATPTPLHRVGCAGRVTSFSETDDGRYMITLRGISRFHITTEQNGFAPYRRANVSWDGYSRDLAGPEHDRAFPRDRFFSLLGKYFAAENLETDWDNLKEAEDELLINSLSMLCPFALEDKQALLEAPNLATRRETLITLIEFALRRGSGEEVMQ